MNTNPQPPTLTTEDEITFYFENGGLIVAGGLFGREIIYSLTDEELDLFAYLIQTELERRGTYGIPPQIIVDGDNLDDMPLIQLQYIASQLEASISNRLRANAYEEFPDDDWGDIFPLGECDGDSGYNSLENESAYNDEVPF